MHKFRSHWGLPSEIMFKGMTHEAFYRQRFSASTAKIVIECGDSQDTLLKYPDQSFDLIYIDARHDYEGVKQDALLSSKIIKRDGILIFNDYPLYDPFLK